MAAVLAFLCRCKPIPKTTCLRIVWAEFAIDFPEKPKPPHELLYWAKVPPLVPDANGDLTIVRGWQAVRGPDGCSR